MEQSQEFYKIILIKGRAKVKLHPSGSIGGGDLRSSTPGRRDEADGIVGAEESEQTTENAFQLNNYFNWLQGRPQFVGNLGTASFSGWALELPENIRCPEYSRPLS